VSRRERSGPGDFFERVGLACERNTLLVAALFYFSSNQTFSNLKQNDPISLDP
jgi:hypothetical protein